MQTILGMDAQKAVKILEKEGITCIVKEYASKRPVEADAYRVIRQKMLDDQMAELTVSGFKTRISSIEALKNT